MIGDKNSKGQTCDYRIHYIDVDISGKGKNMKKFVKYIHQKYYEITGIPKNRLNNSNK